MAVLATVKTEIRDQGSEIRDQGSEIKGRRSGGRAMRERERKLARKKLDVEMRSYRRAGREKNPTNQLLRAVREALRVPMAEIAGKMGVSRSVVSDLERREPNNTVMLKSMSRMAEAMGCKVVYGIVPMGGKTLEELAETRLWAKALGATTGVRG
jgi:predicted DNA-binding mobile mystery protein A